MNYPNNEERLDIDKRLGNKSIIKQRKEEKEKGKMVRRRGGMVVVKVKLVVPSYQT